LLIGWFLVLIICCLLEKTRAFSLCSEGLFWVAFVAQTWKVFGLRLHISRFHPLKAE